MASPRSYQVAFNIGATLAASFRNSFKRAQQELTNASNQANRANRGFGRMNQTVSSLTRTVAGLGAAYLSLNAVKNVAGGAIEAASSLEGYRNTLNVVMKDQQKAAETMQWAVDFANKTPFETDSIVEATVRLQSYGLEAQKVMPAIGDMAGVMNKDVMQAVEAVADAQTGELERLKEFGITKAMIAQKAGEMYKNQEIINNKGQIVEQEKFNNALFALMNDRFKGGMDVQANSFKGIMSTVTGVWKTGLASMAGISSTGEIVKGSFFDILKQKAKGLGDTLTTLSSNGTFERIGKTGGKVFNGISNVLSWIGRTGVQSFQNVKQVVSNNLPTFQKVGSILKGGFESAKPVITWVFTQGVPKIISIIGSLSGIAVSVFTFIKSNWSTIKPILVGIVIVLGSLKLAFIAMSVIGTVTKFINAFKVATAAARLTMLGFNGALLANPITWVIASIVALIAIGVLLYKNWDVVKAKASELWVGVKDVFGKIGSFIGGIWDGVKSSALGAVNTIIGGINTLIRGANSIKIKIPDWVPGDLGGKSFGLKIPQIPKLAAGGITTGPTLAMIGEGKEQEAVLPLSKLKNLLNGKGLDNKTNGGSGEPNIIFNPQFIIQGNADEAVIQQAIAMAYKEFKRLMDKYEAEKKRLKFS